MYRYEVLAGNHCSKDDNGSYKLVNKGGFFDSPQEGLHIRHPEKYKLRNSDDVSATEVANEDFDVNLEIMSDSELREYAKEQDINLGNLQKREKIIDRIRKAESSPSPSEIPTGDIQEVGDIEPEA